MSYNNSLYTLRATPHILSLSFYNPPSSLELLSPFFPVLHSSGIIPYNLFSFLNVSNSSNNNDTIIISDKFLNFNVGIFAMIQKRYYTE